MLWKASTAGEDLFLRLYSALGRDVRVEGPMDVGLDFLVSAPQFSEFVRLVATLEVFMRCVRTSRAFVRREPHSSPDELGRELRNELGLPRSLCKERAFCEVAKQTGHIAEKKTRNKRIEEDAVAQDTRACYLCGVSLTPPGDAHDSFTIEHLWPISFGGETVSENLLPACKDCNNKRKHLLSWASGPVQSTFHAGDKTDGQLQLSLAIARLMQIAATGKARMTLKQAAKKSLPLITPLTFEAGRHYLYFEILPQVQYP